LPSTACYKQRKRSESAARDQQSEREATDTVQKAEQQKKMNPAASATARKTIRHYQVNAQQRDAAGLAATLSRLLDEDCTAEVVVTALDGAIPVAVESAGLVCANRSDAVISSVSTSTVEVISRAINKLKGCNKIEVRLAIASSE
jgi:hypothetical protein